MADGLLSSIISFLFPFKEGQTEGNPLPLKAVPGLITLLDVALFRSVEGQLTGTIASSNSLLACWLDIKHQAQIVLQLYKTKDFIGTPDGNSCQHESLAWQSLESACNAIERLSTDRLAAAANLGDAYESTKASAVNNSSPGLGNHVYSNDLFHTVTGYSVAGVGLQGIRNGILESKEETGRRDPSMQRGIDCWESPRLFCPDFVWADDVYLACRKWIRSLDKHLLVQISYFMKHHDDPSVVDPMKLLTSQKKQGSSNNNNNSNNKSTNRGSASKSRAAYNRNNNADNYQQQQRRRRKQEQTGKRRNQRYSGEDPTYEEMQIQSITLIQLIQHDLPLRLYQFRSAMEAEAVVTKRLYLVKCEYRAPFRAFLEAHQNLLRAPPMDLVEHYLNKNSPSAELATSKSKKKKASSPEALKAELQALLNTPELVELLSLEMEAEKLELDMGKALFPFTELSRTLANKRIHLEVVPGVAEIDELPSLRETILRLGFVLCRKGGSETSTGIRPILLDLLMVPRDDEPLGFSSQTLSLYAESCSMEERIDEFLSQLTIISTLVENTISPSSTTTHPALNVDIGISLAKGCTEQYDPELLKCQLLDWFAIVDRQYLLHDNQKDLQEEILRAEMKMSISSATHQSLETAKDSLELLEGIKAERFGVLKEMVEEVCMREMNLYVSLTGPPPQQVLELRETPSAPGLFGNPLRMAGEALPIG